MLPQRQMSSGNEPISSSTLVYSLKAWMHCRMQELLDVYLALYSPPPSPSRITLLSVTMKDICLI